MRARQAFGVVRNTPLDGDSSSYIIPLGICPIRRSDARKCLLIAYNRSARESKINRYGSIWHRAPSYVYGYAIDVSGDAAYLRIVVGRGYLCCIPCVDNQTYTKRRAGPLYRTEGLYRLSAACALAVDSLGMVAEKSKERFPLGIQCA